MGLLGDFKKLFFGASSVAKSAKNKATDEAEKMFEEGKEKVYDGVESVMDKTNDVAEDMWNSTRTAADRLKEEANEIISSDTARMAKDALSDASDKGKELFEKAKEGLSDLKDKAADATEDAVEKSDKAWDKIIDKSDEAAGTVWAAGQKLAEKAKEQGKVIEGKMDDAIERLKAEDDIAQAKERLMDADGDGFADKPADFGEALTEKHDDFFSKAEKWADKQDAREAGDTVVGDVIIKKDRVELPKGDESSTTAGFSDADGDGNDIVDDAIIVDEEE